MPAGTIRALRVDVTTRARGRLGLNITVTMTHWYAPPFNRFVKFSRRGRIAANLRRTNGLVPTGEAVVAAAANKACLESGVGACP